jgi:ornithine carbamoyltransferase
MWQRFTERARKVVFYAQEEAGHLGENYVSTEHLLLGLVRENDSVAARVLHRMNVSLGRIRHEIERQVSRGDGRQGQDMQLTPRAKSVIDMAYDEARTLNNNYIGTEHLLLGLIREEEGLAGRVLIKLGVTLERTLGEVRQLQQGTAHDADSENPSKQSNSPLDSVRQDMERVKSVSVFAPDDPLLQKTLNGIVLGALAEKARDIFLWPFPQETQVQYCVEGRWVSKLVLPYIMQAPLMAHIKNLAGIEETDACEGQFSLRHEGVEYSLHVTFLPVAHGERVSLSVIKEDILEPPHFIGKPSQRMAYPTGPSPIADILTEHRLRGCDILGIETLTPKEILLVLSVAARLKDNKFDATQTQFAQGQTLAMLFEKPSLRTRVTFEAGMNQLGGHAIHLEGRLGERETVPDVARNLDRWLDGIMARTFDHQTVLELAEYAQVPVINGLSDREHPCQAFADFQTLAERKGTLKGLKLAYVGDGNNVAHSLMLLAAKVGTHFSLSCPEGYEPNPELWQAALDAAQETGAVLTLTHDPAEGVADADAVYTDVWASMGQEDETAARAQVFAPFQVNAELIAHAKPDALIMHCLPAHRGDEITAELIDGPNSVVFDQAENRLHAQKALLALVL